MLDSLLSKIFPICRSITGDGVRQTLDIINDITELEIQEFPSGKSVFDWTIPDEWNIRDAYISDQDGNRLIDFNHNGLHVVSYSQPVNAEMSFQELEPHLHSLPEMPDAIPYRTSYYNADWGFCVSQKQYDSLDQSARYHVVIDSTLVPGFLTLAEKKIPGRSGKEYLFSTYCCHPWMANDNQSGMVLTTYLAAYVEQLENRNHSYRFLWLPETIGAITYLAENTEEMQSIDGGFVVSCCGGEGRLSYKETYLGNHLIDKAVQLAFRDQGKEPWLRPFVPDGSDERQYSSPGFRIPVGTISKDKYYDYDFYHTSLDNLDFVTGESLYETFTVYKNVINILEKNRILRTLNPYCEPQLGKRDLYPQLGGAINQEGISEAQKRQQQQLDAIGWLMFLSDGNKDLISIALTTGIDFGLLDKVADSLVEKNLLEVVLDT